MKTLKIRSWLFSLLAIVAISTFLTSCEQERVTDSIAQEATDLPEDEKEMKEAEAILKNMQPLSDSYVPLIERMSEFNLPAADLAAMRTKDLTDAVLNYELLLLMHSRNDIQAGFDFLSTNYNGIQELLKREDAPQSIFNTYKETPILDFGRFSSPAEKGTHSFKVMFLETLLAQEPIITRLSERMKSEVAQVLLKNVDQKKKHSEAYGFYSSLAPALAISRMLKADSNRSMLSAKQDGDLSIFLKKGHMAAPETVERIFAEGRKVYSRK